VQSELSLNNITFLLLLALFPLLLLGLPKPNPSPPATIPVFLEQSNVASYPLDLPSELFHGINSACDSGSSATEHLHRTRYCPVLAAWLDSALVSRCFRKQKRSRSLSSFSCTAKSAPPYFSKTPTLLFIVRSIAAIRKGLFFISLASEAKTQYNNAKASFVSLSSCCFRLMLQPYYF